MDFYKPNVIIFMNDAIYLINGCFRAVNLHREQGTRR